MSQHDAENFMVYGIERMFDVTRWPRWLRRAFILTIPVSGPVYFVAFCLALMTATVWLLAAIISDAWN